MRPSLKRILFTSFKPFQIAGLKLWYAADQITGLVDADPVVTWSDLSGNANDGTQATAGKRPIYKTGIVNGKPVVRFDGTDDFITYPSISLGTQNSFFIVYRPRTSTAGHVLLGGAAGNYASYIDATSMFYSAKSGVTQYSVSVAHGGFTINSTYILSIVRNNTSVSFYKNGVQLGTTQTLGFNDTISLSALGAYADGTTVLIEDEPEVLIYASAPADNQRKQMENYLGTKYAITVT